MTLRPSPVFKPWLLDLIVGLHKDQTRRLKPCGKAGDFWYFREGIEKGPTGLAHFRNDKAHVRTAEGACVRWRWKRDSLPSIHMPRELARSFALVLEHRQEELQEISEGDAVAEGMRPLYPDRRDKGPWQAPGVPLRDMYGPLVNTFLHRDPIDAFACLWEYIHGDDSWRSNPPVHVYRFHLATRAEALATIAGAP